jgi:hypothetical protein
MSAQNERSLDNFHFKLFVDRQVLDLIDAINRLQLAENRSFESDVKNHCSYAASRIKSVAESLAKFGVHAEKHLRDLD